MRVGPGVGLATRSPQTLREVQPRTGRPCSGLRIDASPAPSVTCELLALGGACGTNCDVFGARWQPTAHDDSGALPLARIWWRSWPRSWTQRDDEVRVRRAHPRSLLLYVSRWGAQTTLGSSKRRQESPPGASSRRFWSTGRGTAWCGLTRLRVLVGSTGIPPAPVPLQFPRRPDALVVATAVIARAGPAGAPRSRPPSSTSMPAPHGRPALRGTPLPRSRRGPDDPGRPSHAATTSTGWVAHWVAAGCSTRALLMVEVVSVPVAVSAVVAAPAASALLAALAAAFGEPIRRGRCPCWRRRRRRSGPTHRPGSSMPIADASRSPSATIAAGGAWGRNAAPDLRSVFRDGIEVARCPAAAGHPPPLCGQAQPG